MPAKRPSPRPAKKENLNRICRSLEIEHRPLLQTIQNLQNLASPVVYLNNNKIPRWKDLNQRNKLYLLFKLAMNPLKYKAFTLIFSDAFIERTGQKSLPDYIRRAISQGLKNRLGHIPEFMFVLEKEKLKNIEESCKGKRFHIHGIIQADDENIALIKPALKTIAFGRNYKQHPMSRNILKLRRLSNPVGWLAYIIKYGLEKNCYFNNGLKRSIQNLYDTARKKLEVMKKQKGA